MKYALQTLLMLLTLGLCSLAPQPIHAAQQSVRLVQRASVYILSHRSAGSGFFVAPGYVATNAHVVGEAGDTVFVANKALGGPARAHIVAVIKEEGFGRDYAVLRVEMPRGVSIAPLVFAAADPDQTDKVRAWGFPALNEAIDPAYERWSRGDFTAVPQLVATDGTVNTVMPRHPPLIMHTASVSHGNSGGPLVNAKGEVLGIITYGFSEHHIMGLEEATNRDAYFALSGQDLFKFLKGHGIPAKRASGGRKTEEQLPDIAEQEQFKTDAVEPEWPPPTATPAPWDTPTAPMPWGGMSIDHLTFTLPAQVRWRRNDDPALDAHGVAEWYVKGTTPETSPVRVMYQKLMPPQNPTSVRSQMLKPLANCPGGRVNDFRSVSRHDRQSNFESICPRFGTKDFGLINYVSIFTDNTATHVVLTEVRTPVTGEANRKWNKSNHYIMLMRNMMQTVRACDNINRCM